MKPNYKTSRKYKCPYCDKTKSRAELIEHVDKNHIDMIPENYSAARAVYDSINKKDYGICMICKKKVYIWNDKINRYKNLCDDPKCRAKVRENALERHIRVYNKPTLLGDPEQQEKMLANRRISGTYTFSDGIKVTYTGNYEKNALEFMDLVLGIPGKDIQAPGPVLEYKYNGEVHKWITDIYYIPANLLIEIKDGGNNPNNRSMPEYRDKQIAKEVMITELGKFNYIRLTNNNFSQLLNIFADMKNEALELENPKMKIHINEEVGGLPRQGSCDAYIIPYTMKNSLGCCNFAYTDSDMDKVLTIDDDGNIIPMIEEVFENNFNTAPALIYTGENSIEKINKARNSINNTKLDKMYFIELFADKQISNWQDILLLDNFKYYDKNRERNICKFIENSIHTSNIVSNIVYTKGFVKVCNSIKGYYAHTDGFDMSSDYFNDLDSLESSGVIDLMNDIYKSNMNTGGDINV